MKTAILALGIFLGSISAYAQKASLFKPLRYDEDWSKIKRDSSTGSYDKIKFIPLTKHQKLPYLSLGGEVRYQYFYLKNEDWGDATPDKDGFLLTRFLGHADWHLNKHLRAFVQLQSSMANSRLQPSVVEENPLDLHQAFVEAKWNTSSQTTLTTRIGRQELSYGSQRLVAVREAPNNRMAFDALKLIYQQKNFKSDAFYSHPVANKAGIFDDHFSENAKFWGLYSVINHAPVLNNIDVYYLGIWKKTATLVAGKGEELRHSVGTRIWKTSGAWQYDFEGVYQFGTFQDKTIRAWTVSSNTTFQKDEWRLKPKFGLKTEAISGDEDPNDNRVETFNPLYPKGAYFGLAALIGPSNLFDIHPSIDLELTDRLNWGMDYDIFWRLSKHDGIYAPNMSVIYAGKNTEEKFIGTQLATDFNYQLNPFVYLRLEATWFASGPFIQAESAGKDIFMTALTTQVKF